MARHSIWVGFDPREVDAFAVTRASFLSHLNTPIPVYGIVLDELRARGLYTRETTRNDKGQLFDVISDAPMATEFAISRFLVPHLVRTSLPPSTDAHYALFVDSDMLAVRDISAIFKQVKPSHAVSVVKHNFEPPEGVKMDGQAQLRYARKNWSSVMVFNVNHPSNRALTPELVNSVPGRDLHGFCWLRDEEIGELDPEWNFLVGHHDLSKVSPRIVHFTDGVPSMKGYENVEFAAEWKSYLHNWARAL